MISLLLLTIGLAAPLVLAAMGGYTSERAGIVNIALEGMMLIAASVGGVVGMWQGSIAGLLAGVSAGVVLSMTHWLMTQKLQIDHVVSGMGINAVALGGSSFIYEKFSRSTGKVPHLDVWYFYATALLIPFALWWVSRYTSAGLRVVAVGADPAKSRLLGIHPARVRLSALLATGVLSGLAGVLLVSDTEVFTNNMTAGRGYIALAALVVGGWRILPTFAVCLAFGFFNALQLRFQGTTFLPWIPSQAWAALPYVVTIVALAGFLGKNRTPAGLGKL